MVHSMISQTTLPKSFWDYDLVSATRILNMVPTKKVEKNTIQIPQDTPWLQFNVIICRCENMSWGIIMNSLTTKLHCDLEFDKWLDAMNVEMQSMKDNQVWDLVGLHPNGKTIGSKWLFKKKTLHGYKELLTGKMPKSIIVTSSIEDEYMAASKASKEAVWIREFISGLGITKGAKHYRTKIHYLHEVIKLGDIVLEKVHTDDNVADPFTKALPFNKHSSLRKYRTIFFLPASILIGEIGSFEFREWWKILPLWVKDESSSMKPNKAPLFIIVATLSLQVSSFGSKPVADFGDRRLAWPAADLGGRQLAWPAARNGAWCPWAHFGQKWSTSNL
ncbi:hypothetical protein Tco_0818427 [Tanacetum coccineum]